MQKAFCIRTRVHVVIRDVITLLSVIGHRCGEAAASEHDRKPISPVVTFTKFPATFFPSPIVRSSIYNVYTPRQFLLRFYLRSFYYF